MKITGISTPALVVDEVKFNKNVKAMSQLLYGKDLKLRPHYKSHKCAEISREQI